MIGIGSLLISPGYFGVVPEKERGNNLLLFFFLHKAWYSRDVKKSKFDDPRNFFLFSSSAEI